MTTVNTLIKQLQLLDPEEPILFQYLTTEFVGYGTEDFSNIVDYLDDNSQFADDSVEVFRSWITEAASVLEEVGREDNA